MTYCKQLPVFIMTYVYKIFDETGANQWSRHRRRRECELRGVCHHAFQGQWNHLFFLKNRAFVFSYLIVNFKLDMLPAAISSSIWTRIPGNLISITGIFFVISILKHFKDCFQQLSPLNCRIIKCSIFESNLDPTTDRVSR